jgi:acetyl-CoA C-acetyltransferase
MPSSYIVAARRTSIGKLLGALSTVPAPQLAAFAIRAALADAGLEPDQVDEVILGNVLTAGVGQAPARQAALEAGIPSTVGALTINKVCGSGLKAVMLADQIIRAGDAQTIVAGGMENMSLAPHLLMGSRRGIKFGDSQLVDSMLHDGLWCAKENKGMGALADYIAATYHVSRQDQDRLAAESHRRAVAAQATGKFQAEIAPVRVTSDKTESWVTVDEGPRPDCTTESLSKLRPAFDPAGTATAGNASQISDGAAAVVVTNEAVASTIQSPLKARIMATATSGFDPKDLFIAPISAMQRALDKAGMNAGQIDLNELNEAFASQCLACMRPLGLDPARVNVNGGAIALGHPIGASGARVLVTLVHAMADRGARYGLASLCLGGGNAVAMVVERIA